MRIAVAATPEVAIPTLNWLSESAHEIALLISQPDRPAGRGRKLKSTPVSVWAVENSFPLLRPESPQELDGAINDLDLVLTIGYGRLLPEKILTLPRNGFINLHFSLLPAYRGAAPAQRAIENGETETGVTVFALDKGMDTGAIYSSAQINIQPTWSTADLLPVLAGMGPSVVAFALAAIESGIAPVPQSGVSSYAPKISKEEAKIDWNQNAEAILRRIRAFFPDPVAWSDFKGGVFKITAASLSDLTLAPGEIMVIENEVVVGCAQGSAIVLKSVISAGKKEMAGIDWARGARISVGTHLG